MKKNIPLKDISYALLPKYFWLNLILALGLYPAGGLFTGISILLLNYVALIVFARIAVFLHETGHIIFAKIAGAHPIRIELGTDYYIYGLKIKNFKIVVKSDFNIGLAYYVFNKPSKIKQIFATSGGFVVNFLMAASVYFLGSFSFDFQNFVPATDFAIMNFAGGLFSFIPMKIRKRENDGLRIIRLLFNQKNAEKPKADSILKFYSAVDYQEEKEYTKAVPLYESLTTSKQVGDFAKINLAICYTKINQIEKGLKILSEMYHNITTEKKELTKYIANNIAWDYLLLEQTENALEYAETAYNIDKNNKYIAGTYAAVLAESGKYEKAGKILIKHINLDYYRADTFIKVLYLIYVYQESGKTKKVKKHINYIRKHRDKIVDYDHQIIYKRLMRKFNNEADLMNNTI